MWTFTLSRLGGDLATLILNADISWMTVTAMTPKLNDFSLKYIVRIGRKNGEKILGKKKLQSNAEHLLINVVIITKV